MSEDNKVPLIINKIINSILTLDTSPSSRELVAALISVARSIMKEEYIPSFSIAEINETDQNSFSITEIAISEFNLKDLPQAGTEWIDLNSSQAFIVSTLTNVAGAVNIVDNPIMVVYKDMDGNTWSMSLEKWNLQMTPLEQSSHETA